jgi:hypothetical protein
MCEWVWLEGAKNAVYLVGFLSSAIEFGRIGAGG